MKNHFFRLIVLYLAPITAYAVDGTLLINQASVMASGGFPFKISSPGSYRLSGNLVAPAGVDGIQIIASSVTLDLNGFSIIGPGQFCTGPQLCNPLSGITAPGSITGTIIRNGVVVGFAAQISLSGAVAGLAEDLVLVPVSGALKVASGFGASSIARHISTTGDLGLTCPAVLSESVADAIGRNGTNPGSCLIVNTIGVVF